MKTKRFTYEEYKKIIDNPDVYELKITVGHRLCIDKAIKVNGVKKIFRHKVDKFDVITQKDYNNLLKILIRVHNISVTGNGYITHVEGNMRIVAVPKEKVSERATLVTRKFVQITIDLKIGGKK